MDKEQAKEIIKETFENPFNKKNFIYFLRNLLKSFQDESILFTENDIPDIFKQNINQLEKIGQYDCNNKKIDLLIVKLKKETSLERARTMQRNLIAGYLKNNYIDAGLVAFVPPDSEDWRFSLVRMDYRFEEKPSGRIKVVEEFTPARRWSFLVGKNEKSHTAQSRFLPLFENDTEKPTLEDLELAFNVEKVTEEFFDAYRYALKEVIVKSLSEYNHPFKKKYTFAQQLLSRILFIYFLQRKGWYKWDGYTQDRTYLRNLWFKYKKGYNNNTFYSVWLKSLFFGAFNKKLHLINPDLPEEIKESYSVMPYLNGGLFTENELDRLGYNLPDHIFEWLFEPDESSNDKKKGFFEIFNFTIDESLPVDVEVAVDPEMLGKVYESLINEEERGNAGIFYTPRSEIELMCRLSLVNYLHTKTQIDKQDLIDIVFQLDSIYDYANQENLIAIRKYLNDIKIVDPAVGSGSFLVGMMNILVELHSALIKRIEGREENLYSLKQKIILENLYGVDVKDWAVMVGELRLWLSLIIETDEKYMDIYTKPLLPNLSFKIRQGDSLVEDIEGEFINLRGGIINNKPTLQQKIFQLIDRKVDFFSGKRSADLKEKYEIEKLEIDIFKEIIQGKIDKLDRTLSNKNKTLKEILSIDDMYGEKKEYSKGKFKTLSEEIEKIREEINKYQYAISAIERNEKKDFFLWELDFTEVFTQKGGFDIVIGNPPYVRQEKIAPPLENEDNYSSDTWREIKRQYKDKLIQAVQNVWKNVKRIDKKSDLYIYFYYQGLSLLNDGGIFCFINSNSWLDVGYGTGLQEFLLRNMKPIYIIDNIAKRSFKQADVNTVIVVIQKPSVGAIRELPLQNESMLKFIAFKKPFEEAISPEILKEIERTDRPIFDNPVYRVYPKTGIELLEEGVEYHEESELGLKQSIEYLPYIGNKWGGKYLRAPEIYFKILEKANIGATGTAGATNGVGATDTAGMTNIVGATGRSPLLVKLGDIAEVRFGIKTGANEFFYLKPVGITVKDVVEIAEKNPQALIRVKNGAGWEGEIEAEFLKPVIKSPRELKAIMVKYEDLNCLVFMCHKNKKELKGTKSLEYILWGEKKEYNLNPTCRNRNLWWDLGKWEISKNILPMFERKRKYCFYNQANAYIDAALYWVYKKGNVDDLCLNLLFNSTLIGLWKELLCRPPEGGGGGPIQMKVCHYNEMPIILPSIVNFERMDKKRIKNILTKEIYSIFTELGFDPDRPIREQEPNPLPGRKELDDIIFDALGLTEEERKEVYWAVAELVKARLDKARCV